MQGRLTLPDRYRVIRHLASGGMASVWEASDELLRRSVAVKVLANGYAADPIATRRFKREARLAARVSDHPNVVTIYDVGEHDDHAFIVMELVPGGTVADRMRRGRVPRALALAWLEGAASALDYAHGCDIVHRDVKPGNLLLDNSDRVAVADFGIARIATDTALTQTGQVLGTAAYLSPEQALGQPATEASDRYALAVVAFELLTGRKPFGGGLPAAQARQHVETPVPSASQAGDLPPAVDRVLARGLAKNPGDRPLTACAFIKELRDALGDPAPTAPTRVAPGRFTRVPVTPDPGPDTAAFAPFRPRRRRGFLIALAALVFVVAAVIAAIADSGGNDRPAAAAHTTTHRAKAPAKKKKAKAKPKAAAAQPPATTQAQAPPTSKSALAAQGHALIAQGNYPAAIAVLRQAVQGCPVSTTDPCAYALFDLGHALRLAGQPAQAIPVLQLRLQNPDQRATVEQELALAEAALNGGAPAQGPGKGPKHGKKDH